MKFIVSDHLSGEHSFGKWQYTHDDKVRIWRDNEKLCLWLGYTIEQDIEEIITRDIGKLEQANGKFCVVVLWKNQMKVCIDYFGQTKVYYHTRNGITVTNHLSMLPLTESDVNENSVNHFMDGLGDHVPLYACKDPMNMKWLFEWNQFSHDNTLFHHVHSIPRDHWLEHDGDKTHMLRVYNTYEQNLKSFHNKIDMDNAQLEDKIHQCMEQHSTVIKSCYKNICSSISEGIDSTLQDHYFQANTRLMYHPKEPNTSEELPPKHNIIEQYKDQGKNIQFDVFDVNTIGRITDKNIIDPMLSWLDTVPTIWQLNSLPQRPDILLYGSCADEMFMHVPKFLFARIPPPHRYRYNDSYGGRKSPARPVEDPYNGKILDNWQKNFAEMAIPRRYGRDIETQTGILTTSLYADRRIFNLIHSASINQQLDSMAHVGPQKRILKNQFSFDFKTKYKDGAGYECRMVIKQLLSHTLQKILMKE